MITGVMGVSFAAVNTKEGGLEDVDGVARDSAEEDKGGEAVRMNASPLLSTSGNDGSEGEVSSWSDEEESGEDISGGELTLNDESEARA